MSNGFRWFDDWYALEDIAPGVTAIGEPLYHQVNWNYLVEGEHAALLFDTGPGVRDIAPVVESLTQKPLTVLPSHMHFDHTGNLHRFSNIAIADLPILRACMRGGLLHATDDLYLGHYEDMVWKPVAVSQWLPIGHRIDLGGIVLEVKHTPGHSPDSISLLNHEHNFLLAADFIYPGPLCARVPGANLKDYLGAANHLLAIIDPETRIFSAHGCEDQRAPHMTTSDVADLANALEALESSGQMPENSVINAKMTLLANNAAFAPWQRG
jgi:hydroxyacylglutathione hydrolase